MPRKERDAKPAPPPAENPAQTKPVPTEAMEETPAEPAATSQESAEMPAESQPVAAKPATAKAAKRPSLPKAKKAARSRTVKVSRPKAAKVAKPKAVPSAKPKAKRPAKASKAETAQLLASKVVYQGPLFHVQHDSLIEPDGTRSERDVIRHNGSVVILAVDRSKNKKDPWIVVERQYRHAANQYLWELPAGKLDPGEEPLAGAQRELAEETGYSARKWKPLVEYFASPGFLGESMKVFLADGLVAGDAHPEADEHIEFRLVKLSQILKMIDKGQIADGKTLTSILLYARKLAAKRGR